MSHIDFRREIECTIPSDILYSRFKKIFPPKFLSVHKNISYFYDC